MKKLLFALCTVCMCLTGCSGESGGDGLASEQVFKVNLGNPSSLDPVIYMDSDSGQIVAWTHEPLLRRGVDGDYEPGLAESVDISDDGLVYTFHLREGNKWQDGSPITSADVVYSFQRLVDPNTASPNAQLGYNIVNGEAINKGEKDVEELGVKALDDYTVEVTLNLPENAFLQQVMSSQFSPVSKEYASEQGEMYGTAGDKILASGPFKVESWEQDYMVTLVKNENYWDAENVTLEKVEVSMAKDANTEVSMYKTDKLSYLEVGADYRPQFESEANFNVGNAPHTSFIEFSMKHDITANAKIREALALTFDREYYAKIMGSNAVPAEGIVPHAITAADGKEYREVYGKMVSDVSSDASLKEKANKLFDEGLAEVGKTREEFEKEFTIHCVDTDGGKKGAQVIQQMWKDNLGVEVSLTPLQVSMLMPVLQDQSFYCVVGGGASANYDDPETFVSFLYHEGKLTTNPEFAKTYEEVEKTVGDARFDLVAKCEKIALDSYLIVPQVHATYSYTFKDNVEGLRVSPFDPKLDIKYVKITE